MTSKKFAAFEAVKMSTTEMLNVAGGTLQCSSGSNTCSGEYVDADVWRIDIAALTVSTGSGTLTPNLGVSGGYSTHVPTPSTSHSGFDQSDAGVYYEF